MCLFLSLIHTDAAVYTEEEEWSDEFDDDADEAAPGLNVNDEKFFLITVFNTLQCINNWFIYFCFQSTEETPAADDLYEAAQPDEPLEDLYENVYEHTVSHRRCCLNEFPNNSTHESFKAAERFFSFWTKAGCFLLLPVFMLS